MHRRSLARWCRRELRAMGVGAPLDLDDLTTRLALRRGRPIDVLPYPLRAGAYGLWLAGPDRDEIYYQSATTPLHQREIVLHEIGHMLAGHVSQDGTADVASLSRLMPTLPEDLIRSVSARTCFDADAEHEAEQLATIISEWSSRIEHLAPSTSGGSQRWLDGVLNEPVGWL